VVKATDERFSRIPLVGAQAHHTAAAYAVKLAWPDAEADARQLVRGITGAAQKR
jgi:hypothetical protein